MAKLHFYFSAMNAGKSTLLLQSSHNYIERGMDTLIFSPAIDDRYGRGKVTTRIGLQADAITLGRDDDVLQITSQAVSANVKIRCVLVDEAQFLTKSQVYGLTEIVDQLAIPVLAYGLRADFKGEPFEGSQYLMAWSDQIIELKTICHCGRKAIMNMRVDEAGVAVREGAQIQIGGNESYVATCRKHYKLGEGRAITSMVPNLNSKHKNTEKTEC